MGKLQLTFLDVQHGSACHIETPAGMHFMFDLGTGDFDRSQGGDVHSPLVYLKRTKGVERLDGVFVSHPHRDHIDDIFNFDLLNPRSFWRPQHLAEANIRAGNRPGDAPKIDKYLEISNRYNQSFAPGESPGEPSNNGCNLFEVFIVTTPPQSNLNNHSIAAVIEYAGTKVLVTGDTESAGWDELLSRTAFVNAAKGTHILLAPHHGRESGFKEELFAAIGQPALTIISDTNAGETCVRQKYYNKSTGWGVSSRAAPSTSETRYCLTTRDDGTIQVSCWIDGSGKAWRSVTKK